MRVGAPNLWVLAEFVGLVAEFVGFRWPNLWVLAEFVVFSWTSDLF